jgi:TetR/AcrR family transcriptional regulator, mexJK operon transcriptional repressor
VSVASKKGRSKSEEKRCQIIHSAAELFLGQGYESCSMEAIAKMAGVSKQTVYSHFGSKAQLFSDAVEATCEQYHIWDEFTGDYDCQQALEAFCVRFAQLLASPESIGALRLCVAEAGRSEVANLFWQAGPSRMRDQLRDFLQEQQRQGNLCFEDAATASAQLIAMLHGDTHTKLLLGIDDKISSAKLEQYAKACAQLFYKAYRA